MDSRRLQSKAPATRIMKLLGALVACIFAIAIPFWYYMLSVSEIRESLAIETFFLAKSVERIIQTRPDMWEFESVRLQEIVSQTVLPGKPLERIIRNAAGTVVEKTATATRRPLISVSVTLFDSGRPVGSFEARHSIRTPVVFTVLFGIFSSFLGTLIYVIFRTYPIKKLDRTLADLQRAEEEQRLSRAIAEQLAEETKVIAEIGRLIGSTLDIDEVYERFAAEVRKLIPFDRLAINLCSVHDDTLSIAYVFGSDISGRMRGDSLSLSGTVSEAVIRTRTGLLLNPQNADEVVAQFPAFSPSLQAGMLSFMAVPLISRDEAIGTLHFRSKTPNAYTEQDLQLAERIGAQIAGAIANAQLFADLKDTENSLRESEGRFRGLVEQAAVGVAEIFMNTGRFLTVNRRLCEMVGRTEEEMLATTFQAITHPEDLQLHVEKTRMMLAGEIRHYSLEKRYLRKDGGIVWVNITVSPLWKPGEAPGRNIVVVEDITDRKRMEEENERRSKQMAALHEMGLELTAELNLNALLQSIAERALNLIGGKSCNCYIYRPESDSLERVAIAGEELVLGAKTRRRGEGVVGQVWATGAPILINDYHSWPGRERKYDNFPNRALVTVPVRWGEEFLGVLNILAYVPHRFTEADMDMLGLFAMQSAIAIRNARLYSKIEQLSVTDELTGLFNRRGFFQLGEREFERALRFGRPLSALMLDIDNFKRVNDTHGHTGGDQVLRVLADCFRQNTRAIDIAGRYGGEEFAILLPEILQSEAIQIAERLRQSMADLSIPIGSENGLFPPVDISIAVSIGVAALSKDVPSLTDLISRADQALYRAKDSGRNRVVVWEERENNNP
ncbi:MAG: diguanylate cyclase [Proteobacteria bacterium]|nr:diguanylate cyclase [Pseudomonadota bacterium]